MPERILCVDDEANILAGMQRNLRKQYSVETALCGEDGLAAIRQNGPFAVVVKKDLQTRGNLRSYYQVLLKNLELSG